MARRGGIIWAPDTLTPSLLAGPRNVDRLIQEVMEYEAVDAQNTMRSNARWNDQTGNARQGLFARAGQHDKEHFIVLYHTMPYGIWLEVRWNGRYAIIEPTMVSTGRNVMQSLRGLMNRLDRV